MKKVSLMTITAFATAALTISASAAAITPASAEVAAGFTPVVKTISASEADAHSSKAAPAHASAPLDKPSGQWENIGKGIWYEDLMTYYSDFQRGMSWVVDIEQSVSAPGWYRMLPYKGGDPVSTYLKNTDTQEYFYVNTTNPEKVYFEDFRPFNKGFWFCQRVDEGGWGEYGDTYYGKFKDGIISFPAESADVRDPDLGWPQTTLNGDFRIALPGSKPLDFTLTATSPYCSHTNEVTVSLGIGDDISSVKLILLKGEYAAKGNEAAIVAQGQDLNPNLTEVAISTDGSGMFTLLLAGRDDADEIVAATETLIFFPADDNDNWADYGTATFNEDIISEFFGNVEAEEITAPLQKHKTQSEYYRIVNPLSQHTTLGHLINAHDSHNHYMYINTDGAGGWYIEASTLGLEEPTYGQAAIWSWAERYAQAGMWYEGVQLGYFGTKSGNTIKIPAGTLLLGFSNHQNGAFMNNPGSLTITLHPDETGIADIETSGEDAPAEYFNLQGMKVVNPEPGALYIVRKGATVSKIIF